jgi:hypothetical protein
VKKKAPTEPCKLCGETATLQWSHIIPAWTYRRLLVGRPAGSPASPVRVEGEIAIADPKQDAEYMLCRDCEEVIGRAETYVAAIALQDDGTFPALANVVPIPGASDGEWQVADASALDTDALAAFAASVVWRASASTLYGKVTLGEKHGRAFASYIRGKAPFPSGARLLVEFLDPKNLPRIDRMVVAPESAREDGYHVHQFCMFGMWFRLAVGGVPPKSLDPFSLVRTKRVVLSDGRRLLRAVATRAHAVTPKGSLAKRAKPK